MMPWVSSMLEPVVITGCGWVTPRVAGDLVTVLAYYARIERETPHPSFEPVSSEILAAFGTMPGEAAKEPAVRLPAAALELAWRQAGLSRESYPSDRKGMVIGCALAGVPGMIDFANDVREQSARFVSPIRFPQTVGNYISGALSRAYDFRGPASTIACGNASSLDAIIEGASLLRAGRADVIVAGGTEAIFAPLAAGLSSRHGHVAEGACLFIIERPDDAFRRGAAILATLRRLTPGTGIPSPETIQSVSGFYEKGAVCIEQWCGCMLGAGGAAALAAGIGAANGIPVPRYGAKSGDVAEQVVTVGPDGAPATVVRVAASDASGQLRKLEAVVG